MLSLEIMCTKHVTDLVRLGQFLERFGRGNLTWTIFSVVRYDAIKAFLKTNYEKNLKLTVGRGLFQLMVGHAGTLTDIWLITNLSIFYLGLFVVFIHLLFKVNRVFTFSFVIIFGTF